MVSWIDKLSSLICGLASLGLLAMTLIVGFEVGSRYLFNSPTIWAWDINTQLMLLMLMLGLAETYRKDVHVRVDIFTNQLSARGQAILNIVFAPVFFFVVAVIAWNGWEFFHDSWTRQQHASTIFAPPLYPIKFTIPLGSALLFLQGIAKLVRDISVVAGGTAGTAGEGGA